MRSCAILLLLAAARLASLNAGTGLIDFEGFADSTILATQYSSLTFSNALILSSGISLNEFECPPHSGTNTLLDNGGPITITFTTPAGSFSGFFTYRTQLSIQAFDAQNNPLGTATSKFFDNLALSGIAGSSPNEMLQISSSVGISRVVITGDPAGNSFTTDDLAITALTPQFSLSPTSVDLSANGGSGTIGVTANLPNAAWTAVSNVTWIMISSGASGTGSGSVGYTVAANAGTTSRTGTITVAGQTFTVTQAGAASLGITKTHTGDFTQGQAGAVYTVTVSNAPSAGATSGTVTVAETPSVGLTLASISGAGWTCGNGSCARNDALAGGTSYPPITVIVNVTTSATSSQVNRVSVSGGGSANATATDPTIINPVTVPLITEYAVPTLGGNPSSIASGPDGALWFTEVNGAGKIGRITTSGSITEYPTPTQNSGPAGITPGPDGLMWFTESLTGRIGKITTGGTVTEYALASNASQPQGITAGPDGALWFTEQSGNNIGRITTSGAITEYPIPTAGSAPYAIISGPDGALWFTESTSGKIGRITTAGLYTEYNVPAGGIEPYGITAGPDGALWFTQAGDNDIWRITAAGFFSESNVPTAGSVPYGIASAPDGALWFAEFAGNNIGRMTTGGTVTEYPIPTAAAEPESLAVGSDGAIWFTEFNGNKIGRVSPANSVPSLSIVKNHAANFSQAQQGVTYGVTVSNASGAATTSSTVTVTERLPSGLALVSMGGTGWACSLGSALCTRGDVLAGGSSYPLITITANVGSAVPSPQVNVVRVSGGGSATATATDPTTITPLGVGSITEYPVPTADNTPLDIVSGPDGTLWFTAFTGNMIARTTTTGLFSGYSVPTSGSTPWGITAGPDGSLWFTESKTSKVGRLATGGSFTEYPLPVTGSGPSGIAAGPDGAVWFAEADGNRIGRITTTGSITEYTVPTTSSSPITIATGSDGALWFTEYAGNKIGRIAINGSFTEYSVPTPNSGPRDIAAGPDGALWFTEELGDTIGKITTAGLIMEFSIPTESANPVGITAGPDGALWFVELNGNNIGRITTGGSLTEYPIPTPNAGPGHLAAGPDGALWFTEELGNKIGRVLTGVTAIPALGITKTHVGNFSQGQQAATYTLTVSNALGAGPTNGTVTVIETVPSGMSLLSMAGGGWTCAPGGFTCTRTDMLNPASRYPPITVTVNVAANASSQVTNRVTVLGGGSLSASASDVTTVAATGQPSASAPLLSPAQGETGVSTTASLTWGPATGATSYNVYFGTSAPPPLLTNTTGSSYSPTMNPGTAYYWAVTAVNAFGSTASSTWSFTTALQTTSGYRFVPVTPCRVIDTRNANGTFGGPALPGGGARNVPIPQSACGIPTNAQAYSLNVTVVPPARLTYLTVWPTGQTQPYVSTLNSLDGRIVANAAIVPAGSNGSISVFASDATHLVIDINGYFAPALTSGSLSFYSVAPCRVADTRNANGNFGGPFLSGGSTRSLVIPSSPCAIPTAAQAYSLNVTVAPRGSLGYLTAWPTGQPKPYVSTLNSLDGSVVANAAIVPAGTEGALSLYVTNDADVVIDINGYFAPAGLVGALSLYTLTPCRVADTRNPTGAFGGPSFPANGTRNFTIPSSACSVPSTAQAYSLNVTVVPPGQLIYITGWPAGQAQPYVSILNSYEGKVVANAAIVPAGTGGALSIFVSNATDVILDINGYFAQ